MKRLLYIAAALTCAGLASACGSGENGSAMATVITDRPTALTQPSPSPRSTVPATTTPLAPTTIPTTPAPSFTRPQAVPEEYAGGSPGWYYFTSPSGKFECAVAVTETSIAGCHGSLPNSAPAVPGSGASGSDVEPNAVQLIAGSPAQFMSLGDPKFHRFDGVTRVLPYGEVLDIAGSGATNGLQCSVAETTGVTCADQVGHGFTVSNDEFDLR